MKQTFTLFCRFATVLLVAILVVVSSTSVAQTYSNNGGITISDSSVGGSTPYPSTIDVSGGPSAINFMTVSINGFSHTYANDVDILLVSPSGASIILMSDAGGSDSPVEQNIVFTDVAIALVSTSAITSGEYLPTNIGTAADAFPDFAGTVGNPGPNGAATFSSQFGGSDANGTWSLYVVDDFSGDDGSIISWDITFSGVPGCTDINSCNFNPSAQTDDGSCCYGICVQLNVSAGDYPGEVEWSLLDPTGTPIVSGGAPYSSTICLPSADCAYQMVLTDNTCCGWEGAEYTFVNPDGSIAATGALPSGVGPQVDIVALGLISGCTDPAATNFNADAGCDDGSCVTCAPGETVARFSMDDSAGDGWDAGQYTIFDALGNAVASGSLNTAAIGDGLINGVDQFCLASGCYTVELTNFAFPEEASWSILDEANNLVLNQTAPVAATGFALGFAWGDATGCEFAGCTNVDCFNYNPFATSDDGSCICPPSNDQCINATEILCDDVIAGSLASATSDIAAITCTNSLGNNVAVTTPGVWYKFTGNGATVTASTCAVGMWDSKIHAYSGSCGDLSCVIANDDDATCTSTLASTITFDTQEGVDYYLLVTRYSATVTGTEFTLSISCVTSQVLGCTDPTSECYNALATLEDGTCCYVDPTYTASASQACTGDVVTYTVTSETPVSLATFTFDNGTDNFTLEGTTVDAQFLNPGTYSVTLYVQGTVSNNQATYYDALIVYEPSTYYVDEDGDGYGDAANTTFACIMPSGYVANGDDCDDTNAAINPGATEVCNGIDDDCNTFVDNNAGVNWYADADGDGFGNASDVLYSCDAPSGYVLNDGDCDDTNSNANPDAVEDCDLIDNNCNNLIDENGSSVFYADADGDGYGDANNTISGCEAPIGYATNSQDCDDTNSSISPEALDICDDLDNNCNLQIDENGTITFYADADGDGYGDMNTTATGCIAPAGYVGNGEDCDDGDAAINPAASDVCDNIDNNCNTAIDENGGVTYYTDADGDGYGAANATGSISCIPVPGAVTNNTDCDDSNAAIRPGATDLCNWIDDNCNNTIDEGCVAPAPNNDVIGGAIVVPVTAYNVTTPVYGNLYNATPSSEVISDQGASGNQDLWYQFTTPANAVRIRVYSAVNNVLVELQDEQGNLVDVENINGGNGTEIMNVAGLTPNATYRVAIRNMNGFGGAFVINIRRYDASSLTTTTAQTLCGSARAAYVNANAYTFYFTSQTTGSTYTRTITNSTLTLLSNVTGLVANDTYNTTVDATFNVTNGLGGTEVISVAGIVSNPIQITGNTPMTLRATDVCPNQKPTSAMILAQPFTCGAVDFQWEFTQTAPSASLPVTFLKGNSSRYLRLSTVPGIQNGATYNVRVRPRFSNGSYGTWGPIQCVSTIGVAGLEELDAEAATPQTETDVEEVVETPSFTIFPNPIQGSEVNLMSDATLGNSTVIITDLYGRQIAIWNNVSINAGMQAFRPQTELTFGVYFLRIASENGTVVKRFVVE